MKKHVLVAKIQTRPGYVAPYIVTIEYNDGRLSITGVEGPKSNGDAHGSCGQVQDSPDHISRAPFYDRLMDIWKRWHLNDMIAGSPAQEEYLRENPVEFKYPESRYEKASAVLAEAGLNPDNGYMYGHAWLREEVPQEIIGWLLSLPSTDKLPACWAR